MDFDLVLQGTVVLPDRIVEKGYVAVHAARLPKLASASRRRRANGICSAKR